ncbi:hypothetical protein HNP99_002981 [Flavobacterium sp. 28A]|nr:hypothetical protein [Flavobacterium sp. 28A]
MRLKIIFTTLFIFSLLGIQIASLNDWLVLSLTIHVLWLSITSNEIMNLLVLKNKKILQVFNKIVFYLLIVDIAVIFLSISFIFRLLFAILYLPLFYVSAVCIMISLIVNYFILIKYFIKTTKSLTKTALLILSSFFYLIGVYVIQVKNHKVLKP